MTDRAVVMAFVMCVRLPLFAEQPPDSGRPSQQVVSVPFAGCASDGQVGPREAPSGKSRTVPITAEAARRLAYYSVADKGGGVLAPRGWYCFGTYGSSGETLYVTPQPVQSAKIFSRDWGGLDGMAIEVTFSDGATSGRYRVAEIIALVFPSHKAFIKAVIDLFPDRPDTYQFGPYATDSLTYKSPEVVEYETPANADGLGTRSWLKKNGNAISGVAILEGETPNLLLLSMRLPSGLADLGSTIIQEIEREAALNHH